MNLLEFIQISVNNGDHDILLAKFNKQYIQEYKEILCKNKLNDEEIVKKFINQIDLCMREEKVKNTFEHMDNLLVKCTKECNIIKEVQISGRFKI